MWRGIFVGTAINRGIGYDVTWKNGEVSEFDSLTNFRDQAPTLIAMHGFG